MICAKAGDRGGVACAWACVFLGERGAGDVALVAAGIAAEAGARRHVRLVRPGQRVVAPFAAYAVQAGQHASANDQAAAAAGTQDDAEHHIEAGRCPVGGFGEREAVGVVLHTHLAAERLAQVAVEAVAVEPHGIGIAHQAGARADGAGNADADTAAAAEFRFR